MLTYAQRKLSEHLEKVATEMLRLDDNRSFKPQKKRISEKSFGSTGPKTVADCGCQVEPWEDCEHTVDDTEAMQLIKAHCT